MEGDAAREAKLPDASALYDEAPCGLMLTTQDGLILRVNTTLCRWLGREREALEHKLKVQDLLTMGGRIFHQTHWAPLLQIQGSVAEVKLELLHQDGRRIPMVLNALVREHPGEVLHEIALFVAEDRHKYERELLLARKRAEEILAHEQETQRALSAAHEERDRQRAMAEDRALIAEQMIGIVSHDLRTPLSVIRLSAHLLGMGELSSNQLGALGRLTNAVSRASRLIVDLLDFTKARLGGGLKVGLKPIELHALVADCVEELRLAFPTTRLEHRSEGAGDCTGSSDRLVQMIGNLVANAVAYGDPHQPVTITSRIDDATFTLAVHNRGAPIASELLPRLFEPMTRGDDAEGSPSSVGLGLFIVREIVRAHGGEIGVESAEHAGTTFEAVFPR